MNTRSAYLRTSIAALLFCTAQLSVAQSTVDLESEENRISYSIGVNIAQNLVSQGLLEELDLDIFIAGLRDSVAGQPRLNEEEMMTALMAFQQQMMELDRALRGVR